MTSLNYHIPVTRGSKEPGRAQLIPHFKRPSTHLAKYSTFMYEQS